MRSSALVALVALCRAAHLLAQLHTAATMLRFNTDKENAKIANKSLEFVKIIREDLRRNNDDYALLERHRLLAAEQKTTTRAQAQAGPGVPPAPPPPPPLNRNRIPPVRPPAYRAQQTKRPPPKHGAAPHHLPAPRAPPFRAPLLRQPPKLSINTRRGLNMTHNLTSEVSTRSPNVTQFRSYTHSKHYKKVRVDKLKRLVDKEKNRMREGGRTATEGSPSPTSAADTAADTAPAAPPTNATAGTPPPPPPPLSTTRRPHKPDDKREQAALRHQPENTSPSPDQLDMAPARGPQITLIRFKGRLCQRSVMSVEGPTYDNLGKTVRPAYRPDKSYGRQFHHTRAPTLILPRCCNCCKKSVLGCQ